MNYQKIYDSIMKRAKAEEEIRLNSNCYYERHHVVPVFMFKENNRNLRHKKIGTLEGNPDSPDNVVLLTAKEHMIAHILLYVINRETKYALNHANSINIMLVSGGNRRGLKELLSNNSGRVYERLRRDNVSRIKKHTKGTLIAKCSKTGKMIGRIANDDPKYLSGEYVFFHKGMTRSDEWKAKASRPGLENANSSGIDDREYLKSYLECCDDCGIVVTHNIWINWSKKYGKPHLQHINNFRFNGQGFSFLIEKGKNHMNMDYDPYFTRKSKNKEHTERMTAKWLC